MRALVIIGAVALTTALFAAADAQSPQAQADATYGKLMSVIQAGLSSKGTGRRTVFTQSEMNAYLQHRAQSWLPTGLTSPQLDFVATDRVATTVVADLDGVRRKSSGGWFDPTAYLRGRLPVYVVGTLTTQEGHGRFDLEQATVDGIPVPRVFIQELLAYYTSTPEQPAGVRLDEPFLLPSAIDRIDVRAGQATVVQ
jgi:hypothetical protein